MTGAATAGPRVTGQPHFSIVAMAASAGGVTAMTRVLRPLPASLPVPIVAVEHLDPRHETVIAEVLRRRTALGVKLAEDGERAHPGTVYVAPPNRHLLVQDDGSLALSTGEMVHFLRPCADLLFESVAGAFGERALAIVLSGSGSDGAVGVEAIEARGGTVIVQDLPSAEFNGMPRAAAETGVADFVLPLDEIGPMVNRLTSPGAIA